MSVAENLPEIEMVDPSSLTFLAGNPRVGDIQAIQRSIEEFGFIVPIVVNSDGVAIAGNHRLKAALELGLREVPVWRSEQFNDELRAQAFALADNRTNDVASYNDHLLAEMLSDVLNSGIEDLVTASGFSDADLLDVLNRIENEDRSNLEEFEGPELAELPVEARSASGDVWKLGAHRVMCGSSERIG